MTSADCLHRAEECERFAAVLVSEVQRDKFLKMAAGWRKLAAETAPTMAADHRAAYAAVRQTSP